MKKQNGVKKVELLVPSVPGLPPKKNFAGFGTKTQEK